MTATPLVSNRPAPGHGEHTAEVLADLGVAGAESDALFATGAVFTQPA
jgi:crotonobetainyl-CoA:carnitine CoA-transferase CaiB-like acyl-CoA transferase